MNGSLQAQALCLLAVLVGAPAASSPMHGLWVATIWAGLLLLSTLTERCSRNLRVAGSAAWLIRVVVCTGAASALCLWVPAVNVAFAALPLASWMLLALAAAAAPAAPSTPRATLRLIAIPALILLLTGSVRILLPAMNPGAAAALGLAVLAAVAVLLPRLFSDPETDER